ncbi:MAG: SDR family oxidoreductase [Pseudomonadota bacterium]|nr:SDR family oxidoreductase [Pseudomonadota bacterium]
MKLAEKTAIVTGAGRNIGEEIAVLFAQEGAKVAVVDMDESRAKAVADRIKGDGGEAAAIVCDVSNTGDIAKMVSSTVDAFGAIDILVNNVAISDNKDIFEITEEEWRKTIDVTLSTPFYVTKQVANWMVDNDRGGKVINIGSTSGFKGRPSARAYTAAKGGVANLTQSMAVQLAPYGIIVNQVSPNMTGSPVGQEIFDRNRKVNNLVGRPGEPDEQAKAVLFLASDDASFIAGANLFVDGGTMAMASFASPAKRKDGK